MDPYASFGALGVIASIIKWGLYFAILAAAIFIGLRIRRALKQERIIDQWTTLIKDANGEGNKVITGVIRNIEQVEPPNIHVSKQMVKPGRGGFIRKPRELLVAEHKFLDTFDMYIGARDYGKQLFVSWYLVAEPMSFLRLFKRNPFTAVIKMIFVVFASARAKARGESREFYSTMNIFDAEEVAAYASTVHRAVLESVKEVVENRHLDFTKVDTKSRGFLNLS